MLKFRWITFLSLLLTLTFLKSNGQNEPREVTPDIAKKINIEVEQAAQNLKKDLLKYKDADKDSVEFAVETFRIEKYEKRYIDYDYSTAGMSNAAHESADKYDKLLNKYYKLLLNKLDKEDKDALVQAQRAWIAFRDKELDLESTLTKEKYSGGGTMQIIIHASFYEEIIRNRVIALFEYYNSIGKF